MTQSLQARRSDLHVNNLAF